METKLKNRISNKEQLKESYNFWYSKERREKMLRLDETGRKFRKYLFNKIGCRKGDKILEVACGTGKNLIVPKEKGLDVYGIDISEKAIEVARQILREEKNIVIGEAESLPWKDNYFDKVLCWGSLEHFLNMDMALKEMFRVSKKDGRLCIIVPNSFWFGDIVRVVRTGYGPSHGQELERFASFNEWKDLIQKNGCKVIEVLYQYPKSDWTITKKMARNLLYLLIPKNLAHLFCYICVPEKQNS